MYPQDSGTPTPEAAPVPEQQQQVDADQQTDSSEELQTAPETAPQLTDEDYHLNFLGTDKFDLPREVPEEIRSALKNLEKSLNKGWTEKNMRLAEERRAAQQQHEEARKEVEIGKVTLKEQARLEALQDQISQYDNVDWAQWAQTDPAAANAAFMAFQGIQRQHAKLDGEVKTKQDQERQRQSQQAQAWLQQADDKLRQTIKDWSPEKGRSISGFVAETYLNTNTPMDQGALQAVSWHPGLVQMAHEAMLYRDSLKRAAAVPKPTPAVPVSKVGGVAPVAKDPEKMTDEEWARWRQQDIANKRKAAPMNRIRR